MTYTLPADALTAVLVFAATNIDDVFLLLAFFADRRYRASHVIVGQYLGIAVLVVVSLAASLLAAIVPREWLGLLGLIPLALGIKALLDLRHPDDGDEAVPPMSRGSTVLTVASITIANGGDNIGVYTPLFATLSLPRIAVVAAVFAIMIAVWCDLARRMVRHPSWGALIRRYMSQLLPFVFIGLGCWIVFEMGTLRLLTR